MKKIEYAALNIVEAGDLEVRTREHIQRVRSLVLEVIDERGMTKTELAKAMGISKSHLSNILNSQTNLTLETIARFELALGVRFEIERQ